MNLHKTLKKMFLQNAINKWVNIYTYIYMHIHIYMHMYIHIKTGLQLYSTEAVRSSRDPNKSI